MEKVVNLTPEEVSNFLKENVSETRFTRSKEKFAKYPVSGTFARVGLTKAMIDKKEREYPCVFIINDSNEEIGNISFSAIHRFVYSGNTQKVSKVGKYTGKYMNGTKPLHSFSQNRSEAEVISYVLGKSYTAKDTPQILALVDFDENTKVVKSIVEKEADLEKYRVTKDVCTIKLME